LLVIVFFKIRDDPVTQRKQKRLALLMLLLDVAFFYLLASGLAILLGLLYGEHSRPFMAYGDVLGYVSRHS
jgi:hypothetical protein